MDIEYIVKEVFGSMCRPNNDGGYFTFQLDDFKYDAEDDDNIYITVYGFDFYGEPKEIKAQYNKKSGTFII